MKRTKAAVQEIVHLHHEAPELSNIYPSLAGNKTPARTSLGVLANCSKMLETKHSVRFRSPPVWWARHASGILISYGTWSLPSMHWRKARMPGRLRPGPNDSRVVNDAPTFYWIQLFQMALNAPRIVNWKHLIPLCQIMLPRNDNSQLK